MFGVNNVLIGIQARSSSTRLPRKAFELIGEKMMLDHVVDTCKSVARHLETVDKKRFGTCSVAILTPEGDDIIKEFTGRCQVLEGPLDDVLTRYMDAANIFGADIIVRVTGDCPLIPDTTLTRHIKIAEYNDYDYCSNVDEAFRTSLDGHDCEVLSIRMLRHLHQHAKTPYDREHVTPMARRDTPPWAKIGCVIHTPDLSGTKLSVDTPEDLERVRSEYNGRQDKVRLAERKFGKQRVHRI